MREISDIDLIKLFYMLSHGMASNKDLEFIGEVVEILPAGKCQVYLNEMDIVVSAKMSGKMKINRITVMEGDYVKVELSEYDMSQGRIVYRYKDPQQALLAQQQVGEEGINDI